MVRPARPERPNTTHGGELPLPVGIVRSVVASEPSPQLGMRIVSSIGSDCVGVRRIDGQLDNHSIGICDVERRAVAMLKDKAVGLSIARGGEPFPDLVLCFEIALSAM
jgi:hypothetical protein